MRKILFFIVGLLLVSPLRAAYVEGELIIQFRPEVTAKEQKEILSPVSASVETFSSRRFEIFNQLALVRLHQGKSMAEAIAECQANPKILLAEPNYIQRAVETLPNDPGFVEQWNFRNIGQLGGTPDSDIDATDAWDNDTGTDLITVAVVDTGVDYQHEDLAANIWTNPNEIPGNFIDDDQNGFIDDIHGYDFRDNDAQPLDQEDHGTHIAGIIGAVGNNNLGVTGLNWTINIMVLRFIGPGGGNTSDAIRSISYAADNGARVINASWGNEDPSVSLQNVIDSVHQQGVLFVAAAGNLGRDTLFYPAAFPHAIAVAATDEDDEVAIFSNHGSWVDVAAPGVDIYSTLRSSRYGYISGTSMAAPHVTGLAALLLSENPNYTNQELKDIILQTADPIVSSNNRNVGAGRINAKKALMVQSDRPIADLQVTKTKILTPEIIPILGSARGLGFRDYVLDYGLGDNPLDWVKIKESTGSVKNGLLANWDASVLLDGPYTVRLTVRDTRGASVEDRVMVLVGFSDLLQPDTNDIYRKGDVVDIAAAIQVPISRYEVHFGTGKNPTQWSDAGMSLAVFGPVNITEGVLARWDTNQIPSDFESPNGFYRLRLTIFSGSQSSALFKDMIYLDEKLKPGFPLYLSHTPDKATIQEDAPFKLVDLDQNGKKEIIIIKDDGLRNPNTKPELLVYDETGSLRWSRPIHSSDFSFNSLVVGDVDQDGFDEIFFNETTAAGPFPSEHIRAFNHDGTPLAGNWPYDEDLNLVSLSLGDVDGDQELEIIARSNFEIKVAILNARGQLENKLDLDPGFFNFFGAPPVALGNFDTDPAMEMVLSKDGREIGIYNADGSLLPGWPKSVSNPTSGVLAPTNQAVGDIDGDGRDDLVLLINTITDFEVWVLNPEGEFLPGWPFKKSVAIGDAELSSPSLGDLDQDGFLEVVFVQGDQVHVYNHDGTKAEGWPQRRTVQTFRGIQGATLGDITGDGAPDVVFSIGGINPTLYSTGTAHKLGGVFAYEGNGRPIPLGRDSFSFHLLMENEASTWVAIDDIDGNGKVDLIAASNQTAAFLPDENFNFLDAKEKHKTALYVWELEAPYNAANNPWATFQRDNRHSGREQIFNQPPVVAVGPSRGILFQEDLELEGTVSDDNRSGFGKLSFRWSKLSGAGDVTFSNPTSLRTNVSFSVPDEYQLRLTAHDGEKIGIGVLTVQVRSNPFLSATPAFRNKFNPARGQVGEIGLQVSQTSRVVITIYDRFGREVLQLADQDLAPGSHILTWNGRDSDGKTVASGVYHVITQLAGSTQKSKFIIAK